MVILLLIACSAAQETIKIGDEFTVSQVSKWNYILADFSGAWKNIRISLTQIRGVGEENVVLTLSSYKASFNTAESEVNAEWCDNNSWLSSKNYHSITVKKDELEDTQYFIGIGVSGTKNPSLEYILEVYTSNKNLCGKDCSGNGYCNEGNHCVCNSGYIDSNCDVKGYKLEVSQSSNFNLSPSEAIYSYIVREEIVGSKLEIDFEWTGSNAYALIDIPGNG